MSSGVNKKKVNTFPLDLYVFTDTVKNSIIIISNNHAT